MWRFVLFVVLLVANGCSGPQARWDDGVPTIQPLGPIRAPQGLLIVRTFEQQGRDGDYTPSYRGFRVLDQDGHLLHKARYCWDYRFCALMALSTLVSYSAGLALLRTEDERQRKLLVAVPVTLDLALLGFFKYTGFALSIVGLKAPFDIVLPVGISFYTFHTI